MKSMEQMKSNGKDLKNDRTNVNYMGSIPKDRLYELKDNGDKLCAIDYDAIKQCQRDEFFYDSNKRQIVLGRVKDTIRCAYQCTTTDSNGYFVMTIESYRHQKPGNFR